MAQTKRKLKVICTLNKRLMEPDFQMCWRTRGRRPRDVEKALSCVERRGEENAEDWVPLPVGKYWPRGGGWRRNKHETRGSNLNFWRLSAG